MLPVPPAAIGMAPPSRSRNAPGQIPFLRNPRAGVEEMAGRRECLHRCGRLLSNLPDILREFGSVRVDDNSPTGGAPNLAPRRRLGKVTRRASSSGCGAFVQPAPFRQRSACDWFRLGRCGPPGSPIRRPSDTTRPSERTADHSRTGPQAVPPSIASLRRPTFPRRR